MKNDKGETISTISEVVINSTSQTSLRWPRYYFAIPKTCILIECLLVGNAIVDAAVLSLLMTYLTDEWEEKLFVAAAIVNVWEGMSGLLCIPTTYFKERYGCYPTVLLSTTFYIVGLVILGTLAYGGYGVLYMGLVLLSIGKAFSNSTCTEDFLEDQLKAQSNELAETEERDNVRTKISLVKCRIIGVVLGNVLFAVVDDWEWNFKISASILSVTLILFLKGTPLYFKGRFRLFAHMVCYWCLFGKAAITKDSLSPFSSSSELRLCTITCDCQVNVGAKRSSLLLLSSMTPICFTFLMCGIVDSIGNTYFLEQGITMDRSLGFDDNARDNNQGIIKDTLMEVPITILQIVMQLLRFSSKYLIDRFLSKRLRGTRATLIRIGVGFLFSIAVCSIARGVEAIRLGVVRENDLLNSPKEVVPMSIFWLLPQFICLGAMNGLATDGLDDFFQDELPHFMKSYASACKEALTGVGTLIGVLLIFIMKKLSKLRRQSGWFAATNINRSRLDHVYRTLTVLAILNLLLFAYVSTSYIRNKLENYTQGEVSFVDESKIKIVIEVEPDEEEEEEPDIEVNNGRRV